MACPTACVARAARLHPGRYDGLARALNAQGVAVLAQDHRGHGASGGARQRVDSVAPLLILHSRADRVTVPAGSQKLADRASSADKKMVLDDAALHSLLHEPEGAAAQREILAFVAQHRVAKSQP